mgnify:CR=1 FL=1
MIANGDDEIAEWAADRLGEERVAYYPSRGVGWETGIAPAAHLVGERARALDVLALGGLRPEILGEAQSHGAHGIAMMRCW